MTGQRCPCGAEIGIDSGPGATGRPVEWTVCFPCGARLDDCECIPTLPDPVTESVSAGAEIRDAAGRVATRPDELTDLVDGMVDAIMAAVRSVLGRWRTRAEAAEAAAADLRRRIQHAREILTRAGAGCCGDIARHLDDANQILGGAE